MIEHLQVDAETVVCGRGFGSINLLPGTSTVFRKKTRTPDTV